MIAGSVATKELVVLGPGVSVQLVGRVPVRCCSSAGVIAGPGSIGIVDFALMARSEGEERIVSSRRETSSRSVEW